MARRRERSEPAFGSDSFLDVIANLVGIVLIIIVMVGAHVRELPGLELPQTPTPSGEPEPNRPDREIEQRQAEISDLQRRLARLVQALDLAHRTSGEVQAEQQRANDRRHQLQHRLDAQEAQLRAERDAVSQVERATAPLSQRLADLQKAMRDLETRPDNKKTLHYHLPVSRPVAAGELFFECREGRVTSIDLQTLLEQMRRVAQDRATELRTRWDVTETVGSAGPFRLRFRLERDRSGPLDGSGLPPPENGAFTYHLAYWELVPVWTDRGERLQAALAKDSLFRRVVESMDPEQVVLTFFVYPDSFGLYRELRDYLYERGFVVAGRPLPVDVPITGSPSGSKSRGQ